MITTKATLRDEISFSGVGIHSGREVRMRLQPSSGGKIVFCRTDLDDFEVNPDIKNVDARNCSRILAPKGSIQTVEHLLAVFYALGVDSIVITMDADEVPAMDGSALDFAEKVSSTGLRFLPEKKQFIKVLDTIQVEEEGSYIIISPDSGFKISCSIEYDHPAIGFQELSISLDDETFLKEIVPARTFGFLKDYENMKKQGLALGGSLDNALVLDEKKVINGPLRYPDEFVRHKILDLIGDLSLLGFPLLARVEAYKTGHALHHKAVSALLDHRDRYEFVSF